MLIRFARNSFVSLLLFCAIIVGAWLLLSVVIVGAWLLFCAVIVGAWLLFSVVIVGAWLLLLSSVIYVVVSRCYCYPGLDPRGRVPWSRDNNGPIFLGETERRETERTRT